MDIAKIKEITKNIDHNTTYTTCYRDADDDLVGRLYIDEKIYIDFDNCALVSDLEKFEITAQEMKVLKKLILNPSVCLSADTLGKACYGLLDYEFYDCDQMVQNIKTSFLKKIRKAGNIEAGDSKKGFIRNISKQGYRVYLPKKIYHFPDIRKGDGYSAADIFYPGVRIPEGATVSADEYPILEQLALSEKFLHSLTKRLIDKDGDEILAGFSRLSEVFNHISTVDGAAVTGTDVVSDLYQLVVDECRNNDIKRVLEIKGPLGSYKNYIMQYIYLAICKKNSDILPFYLNIAYYEKNTEADQQITDVCQQITEDEIVSRIDEYFDEVQRIINNSRDKTILLFLDGIRDFSRGNENIYNRVNRRVAEAGCKLVICLESDFTANKQRKFNIHPLCSEPFSHCMRITSMSLHKKKESIEFIKNCIAMWSADDPIRRSPEAIYKNLVRLDFFSIDAYWLMYVLKKASDYLFNAGGNIADLYNAICIDVLGSGACIETASELAYEFEFGTTATTGASNCYDIYWRLIRKHRSVLDFLIAIKYSREMTSLNITKDNRARDIQQLNIFNMIIQEYIFRFFKELTRNNENYEHQIMRIAKSYYDDMSLIGKSELTFRMTALDNGRRKSDCIRLIKEYIKKEKKYYQSIVDDPEAEKDSAFLLRSLYINLIYEGDRDAFVHYFKWILTDKMANSLNRGFHLEYFGDKEYIPNMTLLDFEDDVTKGRKTFDMLCLALNKKMAGNSKLVYAAAIELATMCNLIQARIEQTQRDNVFDVKPYINDCIVYLDWIVKQHKITELPDALSYFRWMRDELSGFLDETNEAIKYYHATPFNKFSIADEVEGADVSESSASEPGSLVEHIYNSWLIGMMYLPGEYPEEGYNKNSILQMLLLHDLVKARAESKNPPECGQRSGAFENQENSDMMALLLSGTYPGSVDLSSYIECWKEWNEKEGINYYIAKDVDDIQAIYHFFRCYNQSPEAFSKEEVYCRLYKIDSQETELGREISQKLIRNNPLFSNIMKLFDADNG